MTYAVAKCVVYRGPLDFLFFFTSTCINRDITLSSAVQQFAKGLPIKATLTDSLPKKNNLHFHLSVVTDGMAALISTFSCHIVGDGTSLHRV